MSVEWSIVTKIDLDTADLPVITGTLMLKMDWKSWENVSEKLERVGGIKVSPWLFTEFWYFSSTTIEWTFLKENTPPLSALVNGTMGMPSHLPAVFYVSNCYLIGHHINAYSKYEVIVVSRTASSQSVVAFLQIIANFRTFWEDWCRTPVNIYAKVSRTKCTLDHRTEPALYYWRIWKVTLLLLNFTIIELIEHTK